MNDAEHMDFLKRLSEAEKMDGRSSPDIVEAELKSVRQQIVNFVDAGGQDDEPIKVTNGDLCRWFDRLEIVSAHLRNLQPATPTAGEPIKGMLPFAFTYKNYRDEVATRVVTPISVRFGSTEWHPEPQWLMKAFDHEKQAEREFAMADIGATATGGDAVAGDVQAATPRGCICQDQHRRGYCTEPGCPYNRDAAQAVPVPALVEFFKWAMREGPWDGGDLDGGSVQDKAESLGLIVKTQYDAEKHGVQSDFEHGDDWFVLAPGIAIPSTTLCTPENK